MAEGGLKGSRSAEGKTEITFRHGKSCSNMLGLPAPSCLYHRLN